MTFSTGLIRTIGLVTVGISAYEINHKSREHAIYKTRENTADYMTGLYLKHNVASDGNMHTEKMKEKYREFIMDDNYITNIQYAKNRIFGLGQGLLENFVSLGLGLVAMAASSTSKTMVYKGFVPKIFAGASAAALVALGATNFYKNVLGMGHSNSPGFYP